MVPPTPIVSTSFLLVVSIVSIKWNSVKLLISSTVVGCSMKTTGVLETGQNSMLLASMPCVITSIMVLSVVDTLRSMH